MLQTAEAVIQRTNVDELSDYEEVGPMVDCAGFFTFRRFPHGNPLAQVLTRQARPAIRCLIQFVVVPPKGSSIVSPVQVTTSLRAEDVDADSAEKLRRAPKPVENICFTDWIYDNREDAFRDSNGSVIGPGQILEDAFSRYWRTTSVLFRIRWKIGTAVRWVVHRATWLSQDVAMWALLNFYDIELTELPDKRFRWPFHRYRSNEFRLTTARADDKSPQFFGFVSSQKSFVTNLVVVSIGCIVLHWTGPRRPLRVIYNNTALTTAALVLGFVLADVLGPRTLIWTICLLSRLRAVTLFITRKVPI